MKTVKLGEYIRTISPKTKIQAKKFLSAGRYPVVSQEAGLINGYWGEIDDVMHFDKPVIVYGDHTRVVKFIDFDFVSGADGTKILITPDDLDSRYFYHWLLAHPTKHLGYARHFRLLKELEIEVPSLEEQRRIVARLDAAFEKISAAEVLTRQNLDNVPALQKSILCKYLSASDSTHRLGDIITLQRGYDLPKRLRTHGEYPLASSSGIIDTHNKFKSTGPGVFTGRSGSIGGVFYVDDNFWPLNTTLYVKDFHGNNPRYCYWLLKSIDLTQFSGGTGVPTLNRNVVHEHMTSIVDVDKQANIANKIDDATEKILKLEAQYTKKLAKLAELRQSLLAEAFSTTNTV